jgi:hypothetical protein
MFGVMFVALFGLAMSLIAFMAELYYHHKKQMLLLRLKTRRALAEQVHLTVATQVFWNKKDWMDFRNLLAGVCGRRNAAEDGATTSMSNIG